MEEADERSDSDSSGDDIWAQLVPLDSRSSVIELRLNEMAICYEVKSFQTDKQAWCKITRNKDQVSAVLQNKSSSLIVVDDTIVLEEGQTTIIRCGDEIILGPKADGFRRYSFGVLPAKETSKKELKIIRDPEHAKCSICLNVWHDVVTAAPCFHNFCNGCLSEWLRTCQEKEASVLCPQCRAAIVFVGRNHFLHSIEEDIMQSNSSLRRSAEEIALLDSYASIKSPVGNQSSPFLRVDPPIPTQSRVNIGAEELSVSIVEMKEKVRELRDLVNAMKNQLKDSLKTLKELKAEIRKLKTIEYLFTYFIIPLFMVIWLVKNYVVV